ncbi:ABC transporter ATP-binding protein [Paenibacillus xerothermodurans]|uniref:ABC transporter ATP-binding protein n=1 Tax=Paenibacillus xerothermodurans TaxID=1977292 RepID=A0A2W1N810_PAEXE|nr:ABC transporter ATP-binding protein [Paenibacillus xerothermodurans]PZE20739.1 ABC transporter ATP-binding protein [Paenibacillus xerothermodurans]
MQAEPVLHISGLTITAVDSGHRASPKLVDSVSLSVCPGEMLGIVGESGSGKSITASAVLGLLPNGLTITAGDIFLNGVNLQHLSHKERRRVRGRQIGYVFQNYQESFTPFRKIGKQLVETVQAHEHLTSAKARSIALDYLERVNLPAERVFTSYPCQLSGGQLQRAALASALMLKPSLIIADEPTTALDVLTGKQVLDLLAELQQQTNCAVLLISHDLAHVLKRTHHIAVMYAGRLIEAAPTGHMRSAARHPYTQMLLHSRPALSDDEPPERLGVVAGEPGMLPQHGCPFAPRCPHRFALCDQTPELKSEAHAVACHLPLIERRDDDAAVARDQPYLQVVHQ